MKNRNLLARMVMRVAASVAAAAITTCAHAEPLGGVTTSGSAAINQAGSITTITQASDRAIIRWDQFDVQAGEQVHFAQPSASSITVNRIRDTKPSSIDGRISANGRVVLINPNGMVFGQHSQVDVGGLVASSSDIGDDAAFMAGGALKLNVPGNADAAIVNHGNMTVGQAGLAGLVAPHIENHGVIQAQLGKVSLASGDIATIDLAGDNLIKLEASDALIAQSVKNTGTLAADGGTVLVTAAQARGAVDALITHSGTIRANSVGNRTGRVVISTKGLESAPARKAGTVLVSGRIEALGSNAGEHGGIIDVIGDRIALNAGAVLDVSGAANGGRIHVGGDYQGSAGTPTAQYSYVADGAALKARGGSGDGGQIVVWSDDATRFYGHADAGSGAGHGGTIEVSGKKFLDFGGTVNLLGALGKGSLLLDPTDITISAAGDNNSTLTSPFTPTADDVSSNISAATLLAALASGNVTVQTRATGTQAGNITVSTALSWASGNTLTLMAHNLITISSAINANGGNLVLNAADVVIGAALSGTGSLTFTPNSAATTVGIGNASVGAFNLSTAEISNLTNGWGSITIGRTDNASAMDVRASTWNDNLTLQTGAGVITVNGIVNMQSNNLTINTDADLTLAIANALTGTGNLEISQSTATTSIGLGGGAGVLNLSAAEVARIANGWNSITIGRTDASAATTVNALTWNDYLTLRSGSGAITIAGVQTMGANNLTFETDGDIALNVAGALSGTGTLTVTPASIGTSIGLNDAGVINFTSTEVGRIANGWGNLIFGRTDGAAPINVGALTWNDFLTLQTGSGVISINGTQTMGGNTLTIRTDADPVIGAALTGTSTFTLVQSSPNVSMGLGTGQPGTVAMDDTELAFLTNGWASLVFGRTDSTAALNVGAWSWNDVLTLQTGSGQLNINGDQTMAANNLTLRTDSDLMLGADLIGTGTLSIVPSSAGTSMGIAGAAGTLSIDSAELAHIINGWASLIFGQTSMTGALTLDAATWTDPLTLRTGSGQMTIDGAQAMGGNALTLTTDSDLAINATLTGTGTISITPASVGTSIGVGTGQAGTLSLTNTELNFIPNGWGSIIIGSTTMTGAMNVGARSWSDPLTLRTGSGQMTLNGNISMAANGLTLSTDSDLAILGTLTGTGTLTIQPSANATSIGVGTGQAGTLSLSDAELANIVNGWGAIVIGTTSVTGAMNIGATTWNDPVTFRTSTGLMSVNGTINSQTNNLTLTTNSNLAINANLQGTGSLTITGSSNATSIGIGTGQAGTLSLTNAELDRIVDGWTLRVFGGTSLTGAMNIGAYTWVDSVDFRTSTGALNINGTQNVNGNNLTLRTNTNLNLSNLLVGSGNLTIQTSGNTTMGIGSGQAGTLLLDDTDLSYIADGWNLQIFGNSGSTAAVNVGAHTWTDNTAFYSGTGLLSINGAQTMGSNNLTLRTNSALTIGAALSGSGTLTIAPIATTTTMGVGTGQAGTLSLTDAELAFIADGWSNLTFGLSTSTVTLNVGAYTWLDPVTFTSHTGAITVNGAQTMGANDLSFITNGNPAINAALTGSGTLTFRGVATSTTIGLGTGATGTINLTNGEVANITDGWANLIFGRTDQTGSFNVNALTWNDNVTFRSGTGILTIAGTQTMGANDLTLMANSNPVINADLVGTGVLTIQGSTTATSLGVGNGQAGTLSLLDAELAHFIDGWSLIQLGRTDGVGAINIGAYTWADPIRFLAQGDVVVNGVQSTTETTGTTLVFVTTNGKFVNNAGASALDPGVGGRWLIYSVDENNDVLGGITRNTILNPKTYSGYGPGSVVEAGNVNLYSGVISKIVYLVIDDMDKIYGDSLPTFTFTYTGGLVNGDTLNDAIASYLLNAVGASVLDNAGTTRAITGSFTTQNGYSVSVTDGTLTVVKATLQVEADAQTRDYGDVNPALTISYTGFKNGEDETNLDSLPTASTAATVLSNVGSYLISVAGGSDSNYDYVYTDGALTITKATLTATAQNKTRTYGAANPAFTFTYTGFKNGENASVIDTGASGSSAAVTANVGSYAIVGSGAVDNNYAFTYVNGTLTITKANLTATADDKTRIYGAANPAFTVTYTGFMNGETSAVIDTLATASSTANATTNVGTAAITAAGAVDNNYSFTYVAGTLTINKATLTATASNGTREYGDANPAFTVAYSGFVNGETSAVIDTLATASSAANATSNVGSYASVASGAVDNNYDFTYVDGTLTITKATLTATADDKTREYGDANPAFTVSYTGFKNGETSAVIDTLATASSAAIATTNVGTAAITAAGASDNNYNFTYAPGTLTITKATLTATADDKTREYGDANPVFTVTYAGFKNGETAAVIDTLATGSTTATPTTNVGTAAITAAGASDGNYNFVYAPGTLTITKATLTATADDKTREYGDANPVFTVSYTGFKNGETAAVIDTLASGSTTATPTTNVGSAAITAAGASDGNYNFIYAPGTLTITKATLTATASNATREYGDANPAFTVSYTGFKNGETSAVIDTLATASSAAIATSNAGAHAITAAGASDGNYNFIYAPGTLTITKAMLTATADDATRGYGDANPVFTVSYTGFKNGETAAVIDTFATGSSAAIGTTPVGTAAISAAGAIDTNYDFTYVDGTLTISKAVVSVRPQDEYRNIGDANPAFTLIYTGFKNGENASVIDTLASATTLANGASPAGTYAITASGALDNNYSFVYGDGVLTVLAAGQLAPNQANIPPRVDSNPTNNYVVRTFHQSVASQIPATGAGDIVIVNNEDRAFDPGAGISFLIGITRELQSRQYSDTENSVFTSFSPLSLNLEEDRRYKKRRPHFVSI